jgi:hypothetical protein
VPPPPHRGPQPETRDTHQPKTKNAPVSLLQSQFASGFRGDTLDVEFGELFENRFNGFPGRARGVLR